MNTENKALLQDAKNEKVIIVGLNCLQGSAAVEEAELSLTELGELVNAAGGEVVASALQSRESPDSAWFIGKGKLEEIKNTAYDLEADTIVFDDELSGSQIRNIETDTGLKVLDRTFVILDIFARRAQTREGKLQVELAQLQYRLSRLIGTGKALSRLGGGIGTRGPGETQLETDRRHIGRRIAYLKKSLKEIGKRRQRTRQHRRNQEAVIAAVVGYTNAGKTSLMNALCDVDLNAMDQVFATLDPVARKLILPDGQTIVLVDTVGFIRKLPHNLIEAFKSTLEEVTEADIIIHVTDASDKQAEKQIEIVHDLLSQLDALSKPRIHLLNKVDLLDEAPRKVLFGDHNTQKNENTIAVSAKTGKGLQQVREKIAAIAGGNMIPAIVFFPYDKSDLLSYIQNNGIIDRLSYEDKGIKVEIRIKSSHYTFLEPWIYLAEKHS